MLAALLLPGVVLAQNLNQLDSATLADVIDYAIGHQPELRQAVIDAEITNQAIRGKLADWYPQINFNYNYQHNLILQKSIIGGNVIRFGVNNTSSAQFSATQNLFNRDVLLASSTASEVRGQAALNTSKAKIDLVVEVTKAFYDLLATSQQVRVTEESMIRLKRNVEDSYNRYLAGVADKTDYKRASIQLSNAEANLKANKETLKFKEDYLKTVIGCPQEIPLSLVYDPALMESEILLDTLQSIQVESHIEYKLLQSSRNLQQANVKYSNWAFLPSVNVFGAYFLNYQNNNFSDLYATDFPYSYVGATLSFPLMQGGKRIAKIQEQTWTSKRLNISLTNLESLIQTEYTRALGAYKSNLTLYEAQKENVEMAREVYETLQLQYQNGVRTYLDVITAETDLRTSQINYFNTLNQVLSSKMDVLRVLNQIDY